MKKSLVWQFLTWTVVGFFFCLLIPSFLIPSSCPIYWQNDMNAVKDHGDALSQWVCHDIKITDLALVFFTYCLVIVGWFTMRSGENVAEATERPYIFPAHTSPTFKKSERIGFTFKLRNSGRMPGCIKEVGYQFLERAYMPTNRKTIDWEWKIIPYDYIVPPDFSHEIEKLKSPFKGRHFFAAYISYQDIFTKNMHESWMCMLIVPETAKKIKTERGGSDAWNDWD